MLALYLDAKNINEGEIDKVVLYYHASTDHGAFNLNYLKTQFKIEAHGFDHGSGFGMRVLQGKEKFLEEVKKSGKTITDYFCEDILKDYFQR
jgi:hypothetical protein